MNIKKNVVIIILNWNGWQDTIECLESIYQNKYHNYNVIIVDNNSTDKSIDNIKKYCNGQLKTKSTFFSYNPINKPIKLIETKPNGYIEIEKNIKSSTKRLFLIKNENNDGFAEGNNIGITYALNNLDPDYVMLLNNDTIVDREFLVEMLKVSESNSEIGILGPKIYYYNDPNRIWFAKGKISWKFSRGLNIGYNEMDNGQYDKIAEVEYVSGCAFLIKKEVINRIGLLDKRFFLYFEEIDWTLRATKLGYKNVFVPKGKIWHKISKSGGGIKEKIGLYYITRNRWLFMKRWSKRSDFLFFIFYQILGAFLIPIFLSIYYKKPELFMAYYRGLYSGIVTITNDF
ncbi:glycosyltransferase family 2 protein [Methanobacterium spitsbergense]|uniref:Glycosyltransferase family 2 protein n=1 Tax=Methanobacterium spitsbergense TaxID=2874285 RepID=A0A8T5UW95_9EURY|nr:glycosyltransferase family 2 protein [Methanobacterium spitsbergense]MBZ2166166.1 glycosyltransferase family 2 protein [Methanobacterium spitsbergense]